MEDERIELKKEWSRFSMKRHRKEIRQIDTVIKAQKKALEDLKKVDYDLYKKAIEPDMSLLPFVAKGPTYTPVIQDYIQDGEYEDVTKQYAIQYADTKDTLEKLTRSTGRRRKKKKEEVEAD